MDELFETVTLIQTGKVKGFPIILYGKTYWAPVLEQLKQMIAAGTIGAEELSFVHVVDNVEEATEVLQEQLVTMWHQQDGKEAHLPEWWFLEQPIKGKTFKDRTERPE